MKKTRRFLDGLLNAEFWNNMRSLGVMLRDKPNEHVAAYSDGGQVVIAISDRGDAAFLSLHVEEVDQLVALLRQERTLAAKERKKILRGFAKNVSPIRRRNGQQEVAGGTV